MHNLNVELFNNSILSEQEVIDIIGEDKIREIKFLDQHPEFRAYIIAHEGTAKGSTNRGPIILKYLSSIINKVYNNLKTGIPAYFRHLAGADTGGRESVGEVVGKAIKEINGVTSTIAVIYIKPGFRDKSLNIASIEVSISYDENTGEVSDINDITGIALSSDSLEDPGFSNAKLIQQLNYFIETEEIKHMKLDDVVKWCQENVVKPTQLFNIEDILRDKDVDAHVKKSLQEKHEHARRLETKLGEVEREREEENKKFVEQLKQYQVKIWSSRGNECLTEKINSLEEQDAIKNLIKTKVSDKLLPEIDKFESEEDIQKKVDELVDGEYAEITALKSLLIPTKEEPQKKTPDSPLIPKNYPKPDYKPNISTEDRDVDEAANELLKK